MSSLTHTAYMSRKIISFGSVGLVAFLVLWSVLTSAIKTYNIAHPAVIPPTVRYGRLPKIVFPEKQFNKKTFSLELPNDTFPKISEQAKVYVIYRPDSLFSALEDDSKTAAQLGFNSKPIEMRVGLYQFQNPESSNTLIMNVFDGSFKLEYPYLNDQLLLTPERVPNKNEAIDIASDFLGSGDKLTDDLANGEKNISYWKIEMGALKQANSQSEAHIARVDFFRKNIDDNLKIVTNEPEKAAISILVSGSSVSDKRIVEVNYKYANIDRESFSTYPIKSTESAWKELQSGNYWPVADTETASVVIRRVYLAYFEPVTLTNYMQPVFVFEGDNNFIAYVPAVTDDYTQK